MKMSQLLGKGNFDDVFKGTLKDKTAIAVKTCEDDLSQELKLKFYKKPKSSNNIIIPISSNL